MPIAITCDSEAAQRLLHQLLAPCHLLRPHADEATSAIVYGVPPPPDTKSIVIPSNTRQFRSWLRAAGITLTRQHETAVKVAATPQTSLSMTVKTYYQYSGNCISSRVTSSSPSMVRYNDTVLLTVDVIEEYRTLLEHALNSPVSTLYSVLTHLPVQYTRVPPRVRSFFLKNRSVRPASVTLTDKLPLDTLRQILSHAIAEITTVQDSRPLWKGKRFVGLITHDIESLHGLQNAKRLQTLELRYDLPATWFLPAKHYDLKTGPVQTLGAHGEIGAHGTKHDGKLTFLSHPAMIDRISEAKRILEQKAGPIHGFRSPLLQCNATYLSAIREAGYAYDSSLPTWEPKNPCTMQPHGIGTINLLELNGVVEIPVTVPQDHQMMYVLGLTPQETVDTWIRHMHVIKDLGGLFTVLVHPSYKLANNGLACYEELLNLLTNDSDVYITTLSNIVQLHHTRDRDLGVS